MMISKERLVKSKSNAKVCCAYNWKGQYQQLMVFMRKVTLGQWDKHSSRRNRERCCSCGEVNVVFEV